MSAIPKFRQAARSRINAAAATDPLAALACFEVKDEDVEHMQTARLIWRQVICEGHLAAWAAPGGAGKTTIAKLAAAELASDGYVVYFFQEDAGAADLPGLFEHAKASGYRLLNSTLAKQTTGDMLDRLNRLVAGDADLSGHVFVIDTMKKFLDVMSKGGAREFFRLMRGLTVKGCTVILLGHTNKHRGPDGKLMFEGVGDIRNDVDELFYVEATEKDAHGLVTMSLQPDKVRCMARELSFRYDTGSRELRVLPAVVNVSQMAAFQRQRREDAKIIAAIQAALREAGGMNFGELVDKVIDSTGVGRNTARAVIERYASEDPGDRDALWMDTRMRGMKNARRISSRPSGRADACAA